MFYPSIDITDPETLDIVQFGYIKLQTGQWVHDDISKGRLVNAWDGTALIVWYSPKETIQEYNKRFTRIVAAYKERPQIAEQLYLFGDIEKTTPLFSSAQDIAVFKKGTRQRNKLSTAERHHIWCQKKPWLQTHGYSFKKRNPNPTPWNPTKARKSARTVRHGRPAHQPGHREILTRHPRLHS